MERVENPMVSAREPESQAVTGEACVTFTVSVGALIGPDDTCWDEEQFKDAAEQQARDRLQEALKSVSDMEIIDQVEFEAVYEQSPDGD